MVKEDFIEDFVHLTWYSLDSVKSKLKYGTEYLCLVSCSFKPKPFLEVYTWFPFEDGDDEGFYRPDGSAVDQNDFKILAIAPLDDFTFTCDPEKNNECSKE